MLRATLTVKRLDDPRWISLTALAWLSLVLFNRVTLPLMFPDQDPATFVTSGTLVGLVLPLAFLSVVLGEGPAPLVATAGRDLRPSRTGWAALYLVLCAGLASAVSLLFDVAVQIFVADALLLAALNVLGAALLGPARGWLLGAACLAVASVPGLVPWSANWLYRVDRAAPMASVAAVMAVGAVLTYRRHGSVGALTPRRRLGSASETADPGA